MKHQNFKSEEEKSKPEFGIHSSRSGALEKFINKINPLELSESAEEYFNQGNILLAKNEFDDAIEEFIKVILISSPQEKQCSSAIKALKEMGFSKMDIQQIRTGEDLGEFDIKTDIQQARIGEDLDGFDAKADTEPKPQESFRKPLGIVSILTLTVGGCLFISGLLLYVTSMASRTEGAWVDPAGFGEFFGLIALVPGLIILGLWYLFYRLN